MPRNSAAEVGRSPRGGDSVVSRLVTERKTELGANFAAACIHTDRDTGPDLNACAYICSCMCNVYTMRHMVVHSMNTGVAGLAGRSWCHADRMSANKRTPFLYVILMIYEPIVSLIARPVSRVCHTSVHYLLSLAFCQIYLDNGSANSITSTCLAIFSYLFIIFTFLLHINVCSFFMWKSCLKVVDHCNVNGRWLWQVLKNAIFTNVEKRGGSLE